MAKRFYVDKDTGAGGVHEVHADGCILMPEPHRCRMLGLHHTHRTAVYEAKALYSQSHACFYCNEELNYFNQETSYNHFVPLFDTPMDLNGLKPLR